jgi:regulator of extracellular matrix RemA (YlzA/DUF370 family)
MSGLRDEADQAGKLVDATQGRARTRSIILMGSTTT